MSDKQDFDYTISNFRFLCIFLMTFSHDLFAPSLVKFGPALPYAAGHSLLSYINFFLIFGFSRISSPFLGFVSGYFLAANLINRPYLLVIRQRFLSLYLPAVFWSVAFLAVMVAVGLATSDAEYVHRKLVVLDLGDFFGFTHAPLNQPLNYLVDLFKCAAVSPLLILVLRRFGTKIYLSVTALAFVAIAGAHLGETWLDATAANVLPRADLYLFFSLGMFAQRRWNIPIGEALERLRIKSPAIVAGVIIAFLTATLHWSWLAAMNGGLAIWSGYTVLLLVRITGSLLLLTALPWLRRLAERGVRVDDRVTFNLFCTHMITFFLLDGAIGWGRHGEMVGVVTFYLAPLIATAVALSVFSIQNLSTDVLFRFQQLARRADS